MQFKLARAMAKKNFDGLDGLIRQMADGYDTVIAELSARLAPAFATAAE